MRKTGERAKNKMIKKEIERTFVKIALLCVIVCTVTYATTSAVTGDEKQARLSAEQYAILEEESIQEVKKVLKSHYLSDAGVMLTKTREAGKNCTYQIRIHHKGLSRLDVQRMEIISNEIHKTVEQTWGMTLIMKVEVEDEGSISYLVSLQDL